MRHEVGETGTDSDGSETVQLRVGLEPTSQDSNLAKTQIGTWMQSLNWDHIWSQDLKKLSFFLFEGKIQWETKW